MVIAGRLAEQRACADFGEVDPAADCLQEPIVVCGIHCAGPITVEARVPDRRRLGGRRHCDIFVAVPTSGRSVVKNVLQYVLDVRKPDVQRIGKIVVHRDVHVLEIGSVVDGQAHRVRPGDARVKDGDHSVRVSDGNVPAGHGLRPGEGAREKAVFRR